MGLMPAADRCVGTRRRLVGATDLVECSSLTILPCASQASKYPTASIYQYLRHDTIPTSYSHRQTFLSPYDMSLRALVVL